jgi:DNA-binding NarL/FixJ family response regulator
MILERFTLMLTELENVDRVLHACSYSDGAEILIKHEVTAVMLDINLSAGNGIDLLRLIREKNYPVQLIIIVTEQVGGKHRELCKSLGADHYMNKFDDIEKIEKIIASFQ